MTYMLSRQATSNKHTQAPPASRTLFERCDSRCTLSFPGLPALPRWSMSTDLHLPALDNDGSHPLHSHTTCTCLS